MLDDKGKEMANDFQNGNYPSAIDLRQGLGVYIDRVVGSRKLRLSRGRISMPKTAIWIDDDGKYCSEHYSSKPGLEVYGGKKFETPQELFRHLWLRIVKNGIPASLMSKRDVEEKVDFDETFPAGQRVSMEEVLQRLKPVLGGEKLAHPTNTDLLKEETIGRLMEMELVGKKEKYGGKETILVRDISKGGKVKYYFYCPAADRVKELYGDLILKMLEQTKNNYLGTMINSNSYETWTVTNTTRLPLNSVNFRTGENILNCRLQDNEMFSAIFLAIIKRTFKRAKGKTPDEKLIEAGWRSTAEEKEMITELNGHLSDYFFNAASEADQTVFIDREMLGSQIHTNAKALLVKYLLKVGSLKLKSAITGNNELEAYVDLATKHEDIDTLTRKLIKVSKALKYV
jgi:hypothetical protein